MPTPTPSQISTAILSTKVGAGTVHFTAVVYVNNSSTDNTIRWLAKAGSESQANDPYKYQGEVKLGDKTIKALKVSVVNFGVQIRIYYMFKDNAKYKLKEICLSANASGEWDNTTWFEGSGGTQTFNADVNDDVDPNGPLSAKVDKDLIKVFYKPVGAETLWMAWNVPVAGSGKTIGWSKKQAFVNWP